MIDCPACAGPTALGGDCATCNGTTEVSQETFDIFTSKQSELNSLIELQESITTVAMNSMSVAELKANILGLIE